MCEVVCLVQKDDKAHSAQDELRHCQVKYTSKNTNLLSGKTKASERHTYKDSDDTVWLRLLSVGRMRLCCNEVDWLLFSVVQSHNAQAATVICTFYSTETIRNQLIKILESTQLLYQENPLEQAGKKRKKKAGCRNVLPAPSRFSFFSLRVRWIK